MACQSDSYSPRCNERADSKTDVLQGVVANLTKPESVCQPSRKLPNEIEVGLPLHGVTPPKRLLILHSAFAVLQTRVEGAQLRYRYSLEAAANDPVCHQATRCLA